MKYTVTYSCGHTADVQVFGSHTEREKKAAYLQKSLCPDCYRKSQDQARESSGFYEIVTMAYREYKDQYADCKTVSESYNSDTKTIDVSVLNVNKIADKYFNRYAELVDTLNANPNNQTAFSQFKKLDAELHDVTGYNLKSIEELKTELHNRFINR
jgi:hypothetical protein